MTRCSHWLVGLLLAALATEVRADPVALHDAEIVVDRVLEAGFDTELALALRAATDLRASAPVAGSARVTLRSRLDHDPADRVPVLYDGAVPNGARRIRFTVPWVRSGRYELTLETASDHGRSATSFEVEVRSRLGLQLELDRAHHAPGEVVHWRAQAFREGSTQPAAAVPLRVIVRGAGGAEHRSRVVSDAFGQVSGRHPVAADAPAHVLSVRVEGPEVEAVRETRIAPTALGAPRPSRSPPARRNLPPPDTGELGGIPAIYGSGERIDVPCPAGDGFGTVTILRNETALASTVCRRAGEVGSLATPGGVFGPLSVRRSLLPRYDDGGRRRRPTHQTGRVTMQPARLDVDVRMDDGLITVGVHDADGAPVADAALHVRVVDEAVASWMEPTPTLFEAARESQEHPGWEVARPLTANPALDRARAEDKRGRRLFQTLRRGLVTVPGAVPLEAPGSIVATRLGDQSPTVDAWGRVFSWRYLAALDPGMNRDRLAWWVTIQRAELLEDRMQKRPGASLHHFLRRGRTDLTPFVGEASYLATDGWGRDFTVRTDRATGRVTLVAPGADGMVGTPDDISHWIVFFPRPDGHGMGFAGGGASCFCRASPVLQMSRWSGGGYRTSEHDLTTHAHTALWVAGARTDAEGRWRAPLALVPSTSGWRVVVDVVTREGATGEWTEVVAPRAD